jgi:hypothetical protein
MKKWIKITLISLFSIFIFTLLATTYSVENRVQETCKMAISLYPGDKIDALISVSKSQSSCTTNKSRALWALGQLGDKKALPYLIENFEGIEETDICVYEAQFAIEKIKNESFNLPGFFWRSILEG